MCFFALPLPNGQRQSITWPMFVIYLNQRLPVVPIFKVFEFLQFFAIIQIYVKIKCNYVINKHNGPLGASIVLQTFHYCSYLQKNTQLQPFFFKIHSYAFVIVLMYIIWTFSIILSIFNYIIRIILDMKYNVTFFYPHYDVILFFFSDQ